MLGLLGAFTKPIGGALDFVSSTGKALLSHGELVARIQRIRPRGWPASNPHSPYLALLVVTNLIHVAMVPELVYFLPLEHATISKVDEPEQIFSFDENICMAITHEHFAVVSKAEVIVLSKLLHVCVCEDLVSNPSSKVEFSYYFRTKIDLMWSQWNAQKETWESVLRWMDSASLRMFFASFCEKYRHFCRTKIL